MREDQEQAQRTKLVHWPTPQEYNEALQNPEQSFGDFMLRSGQPALTVLGFPRPITGMFASVYRMHCADGDWAVRCFLHNISDHRQRYAALHERLAELRLPFTLGFQYQENGIRIQGTWYPILKMSWCQGETLNRWIEQHLAKPDAIRELAQRWKEMIAEMRKHGIAHGDLQHGNVLVLNNKLKLVDYDGMYIEELANFKTNEIGHRHYQHPGREEKHFGPWMDNFSAWLIYVSLKILAFDPMLWHQLRAGDEYLLLTREDFENAHRSSVFHMLERHHVSEVREYARWIRYLLTLPVESVPPLDAPMVISEELPAVHLPEPEVLPAWVRAHEEFCDAEYDTADAGADVEGEDSVQPFDGAVVVPFRRARSRRRSRTKGGSRLSGGFSAGKPQSSGKAFWESNVGPVQDWSYWTDEPDLTQTHSSPNKLSSPILAAPQPQPKKTVPPIVKFLALFTTIVTACFMVMGHVATERAALVPKLPPLVIDSDGNANLVATADAIYASGDPDMAANWYSEAIDKLERVLSSPEDDIPDRVARINLARAHEGLGMSYGSMDQLDTAIAEYNQAQAEWAVAIGPDSRQVAASLTHEAMSYFANDEVDVSIDRFERAIAIFNKYPKVWDDIRKQCFTDYAEALRYKGNEAGAEKVRKYLEAGTGAPYVVSSREHVVAEYKLEPTKSPSVKKTRAKSAASKSTK